MKSTQKSLKPNEIKSAPSLRLLKTTNAYFPLRACVLFILLIFGLTVASMSIGGSDLGFDVFWRWLTHQALDENQVYILSSLRLPRTLTALLVGASLGLSGFLLQILLDNPLAEPYTLGLSGGATLGALGSLLLDIQPFSITLPVGAWLGCAAVMTLLLALLKLAPHFQSRALVLLGMMVSLFCGSLVVFCLSIFDANKLSTALHWMMGYCGTPRDQWWPSIAITLTLASLWTIKRATWLDSLLLGEDLALSINTPVKKLWAETILIVSLLTAFAVSLMGLVGFVGLICPHLAQRISQSRRTVSSAVLSTLAGGVLLLAADILGRILGGSSEVPAGSLIALIGAPFLVLLLFKRADYV